MVNVHVWCFYLLAPEPLALCLSLDRFRWYGFDGAAGCGVHGSSVWHGHVAVGILLGWYGLALDLGRRHTFARPGVYAVHEQVGMPGEFVPAVPVVLLVVWIDLGLNTGQECPPVVVSVLIGVWILADPGDLGPGPVPCLEVVFLLRIGKRRQGEVGIGQRRGYVR